MPKKRTRFAARPSDFERRTVNSLFEQIIRSGHTELHQCFFGCEVSTGHVDGCDYLKVEWSATHRIASQILKELPGSELFNATELEHHPLLEGLSVVEKECALSILTDPIEVDGDRSLGNGRHRVVAMFGQGMGAQEVFVRIIG